MRGRVFLVSVLVPEIFPWLVVLTTKANIKPKQCHLVEVAASLVVLSSKALKWLKRTAADHDRNRETCSVDTGKAVKLTTPLALSKEALLVHSSVKFFHQISRPQHSSALCTRSAWLYLRELRTEENAFEYLYLYHR